MLGQHFAGGPGKKKSSYQILDDTVCLYCSGREFSAPQYLQRHVATVHPGSYADCAIKEERAARAERNARIAARTGAR